MFKSPIYEQIEDHVKENLKSQCNHLKTISKNPENTEKENERFRNMFDGAKTLLNILEDSEICRKGTENYLKKMSIEQLKYTKDTAEKLILEKDAEERVTLWYVEDSCTCKYFKEHHEAVAQLLLMVNKQANEQKERNLSFSIEKKKVIASEVTDYLS